MRSKHFCKKCKVELSTRIEIHIGKCVECELE